MLLVVGPAEVGQAVEVLAQHATSVVHLIPGAKTASETAANVMRFYMPELTEKRLEDLADRLPDVFAAVTRVLIFSLSGGPAEREGAIYQDDRTMAHAVVIMEHYRNVSGSQAHVVAEMRSDENLKLYLDLGITQPVPTNRMVELVVARMVAHKGRVSEFLLKLMSYRSENQLARIEKFTVSDLEEPLQRKLVNTTYDELLKNLLDHDRQLVAISKWNGDIVINPRQGSTEATYEVGHQDSLFLVGRPGKR